MGFHCKGLPLLCLFAFIGTMMVHSQTIISVTNGETEGTWGPMEMCPPGSKAISYDTANDFVNFPVGDSSALNTIRLYCNDAAGTNITSTQGL